MSAAPEAAESVVARGSAPVPRRRVLVLSRAYPNNVTDMLGLWIARPTAYLAEHCDVRVVSPVPYCPPLPRFSFLHQYTRFRDVASSEIRDGIEVRHPRFVLGPGDSLYRFEPRTYYRGVRPVVDELRRSFPFDLIHAHFIYPDGVVAHRLARRYGVPFVVTEHAPWVPWLERPGVRTVALDAARAASGLMAVSSSVRDTIGDYLGDASHVHVIPNGVDADVFHLDGTTTPRPDQILYVGVVNFNKGIDVLLEAVRRLRADGDPVRLLIVGGSFYRNTRLQQEQLQRMAAELNLGDSVEFLGIRPPAEVAQLMRESSVVVLPSRAESFGSVLIEALACGTPVVATRSGGPEDIVTPEVGALVPPGDPVALAAALRDILSGDLAREPQRLHDFALGRFGWTGLAERTYDVYTTAMSDFSQRATGETARS